MPLLVAAAGILKPGWQLLLGFEGTFCSSSELGYLQGTCSDLASFLRERPTLKIPA